MDTRTRYPEVVDQGYPSYPGQPGSRVAGTRYPGPDGHTRYPEHEYNYNSELDTSGRYRSYKDSSGDQGDVDSADDLQEHPVPPPHPRQHHRSYKDSSGDQGDVDSADDLQ